MPQRKRKSLKYNLLGICLEEAEALLEHDEKTYIVKRCLSYKPYKTADSCRVLRVREKNDIYELTVGEFITNVKDVSEPVL